MLENILSEMNESLKVIANSVKKKEVSIEAPAMPVGQAVNKSASQPAPMPNVMPTASQPVQHVSNIPQPIPTVAPVQQVPVQASTERNFTKEELARAMSDAVSAGKMNVIMGILGQFKVQTFAEIDSADYNKLASILIEAGVKI